MTSNRLTKVRRPRGHIRGTALVAALALCLVSAMTIASPDAHASSQSAMVDDGGCISHRLSRNDDGSSAQVTLPFRINFFQRYYSSLYINNNGNVTFQSPLSEYTPFRITASTPPIIAPFFADVDTRGSASNVVTYGAASYDGNPAFCVNWRHVGYYNSRTDKRNDFQLLLVLRDAAGDFDIVFNYGSIAWEAGDASGGAGGLGGTPAGAGYSNGDGSASHFYELPGSLTAGAFLDGGANSLRSGTNSSSGVAGRFVFHIASGSTVGSASVCKKYYFVSVRGSGETATGVDDVNGSARIKSAYDGLTSIYKGNGGDLANLQFYQLPYQAMSVDVLGEGLGQGSLSDREDRFFDTNLPRYLGSIDDGLTSLSGYLNSVERMCALQHRTPQFLLFGYSQGSLVIHELLGTVVATSPLWTDIRYVGLVADPGRMTNSQTRLNWGTAPDSAHGVCQWSKDVLTADMCMNGATNIPSHFKSITEEYCDDGDIVCSTTQVFDRPVWQWKSAATIGMTVHGSYAGKTSIMGKSAYRVAGMN